MGTAITEEEHGQLVQASGGQVALFCVIARHTGLIELSRADSVVLPIDLSSYLLYLAETHLDAGERRVLLVAAMMAGGYCQELSYLAGCEGDYERLARVAQCIPLVRLGREHAGRTFFVHEIAVEVFCGADCTLWSGFDAEDVICRVLDFLESSHQLERLFRSLLYMNRIEEIEQRLARLGLDLINEGHCALVMELFERIQSSRLVCSSRLLLVKATAHRYMLDFDEALRLAGIARQASGLAADGGRIETEADLLMARVYVDLGMYAKVTDCLGDISESRLLQDDPSLRCLALGYLATAHAYLGNVQEAMRYTAEAWELVGLAGLSQQARCSISMVCAGAYALALGDYQASADIIADLVRDPDVPLSFAIQARGNYAALICETGRLERALEIARDASDRCRKTGLVLPAETIRGTQAAVLAGLGDTRGSVDMMRCCLEACVQSGDVYYAEIERNYLSVILRSAGRFDESLAESERSYGYFAAKGGFAVNQGWAEAELAASLLAVGDVSSAVQHAEHALSLVEKLGARQHILKCHLVLAEVCRQTGDGKAARATLLSDVDYIRSENANWMTAMYVRAFPGLLGLVAAAAGVDQLPVHMLRMIMPEYARAALPLARDVLDEAEWKRLAVRLLGEKDAATLEASVLGEPLLNVRLFGGLEVMTPDGVVPDRAWKKRKARLLFMMLVTRQGRDVPRDLLLEHLWPDMDEERAKNNFYVIWSAMKRALLSAGKVSSCPYVEHVGGICRVVRPLVRSDLDDFDQAAAELGEAEASGDLAAALAAIRRLREIYRSDLLPSEIYDDWFRPLRERYRVQFGDAMLRAGRMCHDAGDAEQALVVIRAGLEHDSWREDLYQAAMRYQIDIGQRSGAVDMFIACRTYLSEDLGLDPSVETRRLYEEVLAMEEPPQK
ncbi:MAG: BTAD domain-containing putative transcriptional regulator [Coriobacteriia bacterium]|nr:BTAD domain-containing putative transcriptional regulator [Coriobacteriia bacterium]